MPRDEVGVPGRRPRIMRPEVYRMGYAGGWQPVEAVSAPNMVRDMDIEGSPV